MAQYHCSAERWLTSRFPAPSQEPARSHLAFSVGGDGERRSPELRHGRAKFMVVWNLARAKRVQKVPFHHRYEECTDELTNAHVPELCLER